MAISVHMFGLRLTIELQPRRKNGQPAQSTTGVASTSSSQHRERSPSQAPTGRPSIGPMASTSSGTRQRRADPEAAA